MYTAVLLRYERRSHMLQATRPEGVRIANATVKTSLATYATMNRPHNRQQRPQRNQTNHPREARSQTGHGSVPSTSQVQPGATVSIVLKEDQRTGRETPGIVRDLLTRGDHPRGIKVRLQSGDIGRVQRMLPAGDFSSTAQASQNMPTRVFKASRLRRGSRDDTAQADVPPPRTLGDFIPEFQDDASADTSFQNGHSSNVATVRCPICNDFEGDEAAVSHHVDEHLR